MTNLTQKQKIETTLSDALDYCSNRSEAISMAANLTGNNTLFYEGGYQVEINNTWVKLFK
jgi:hypothetical protein